MDISTQPLQYVGICTGCFRIPTTRVFAAYVVDSAYAVWRGSVLHAQGVDEKGYIPGDTVCRAAGSKELRRCPQPYGTLLLRRPRANALLAASSQWATSGRNFTFSNRGAVLSNERICVNPRAIGSEYPSLRLSVLSGIPLYFDPEFKGTVGLSRGLATRMHSDRSLTHNGFL